MISKIAGVESHVPAAANGQSVPAADKNSVSQQTAAAPKKPEEPQPEAVLKADVQPGRQGGFVYTLTNRFTGQKVIEIPRESISVPGADGTYVPGGVVSTKA